MAVLLYTHKLCSIKFTINPIMFTRVLIWIFKVFLVKKLKK